MSRPRKPFGSQLPGRLPATMVKVLAAELADGGRLTRGKRYWADDAVTDIVIGHGSVTGEVQGSRRAPYVVTIDAQPGEGVPAKRELWVRCTCPDDTGSGADACKHAVAVLFALSDEIAIEPEVIERWRAGRGAPPRHGTEPHVAPTPSNVIAFPGDRRAGRPGGPSRDERSDGASDDEVEDHRREVDEIAMLLRAPAGVVPDDLPEPTPWARVELRDPLIGPLVDDALDHLEIRWE